MFVQCLGSGDAFGSQGKLNTSFFIRSEGKGIVLDCGPTTLAALKKVGLSSADVDAIIVSHLHGDHFGGIPFLITERQVKGDPAHSLTVFGPEGVEKSVTDVLRLFFQGIGENLRFPLRFVEYKTAQTLHTEDFVLRTFEAKHAPQSNPHSLRIEKKR